MKINFGYVISKTIKASFWLAFAAMFVMCWSIVIGTFFTFPDMTIMRIMITFRTWDIAAIILSVQVVILSGMGNKDKE